MPSIRFVPILPKFAKLVDDVLIRKELKGALDHISNIVRDDFKKTTQTWDHKPTFEKDGPRETLGGIEAEVFTTDEIYTYVSKGTKPHPIRPRRARLLRFRTGYRPKTRPRVIGSRAGGASGPFVSALQVFHPGTEAREFDLEIAKRRQRTFENLGRLAILRGIRKV